MKNWADSLLKSLAVILVTVPMLSSCYDDSALWEKIDDMEFRLDSLENNLNGQVEALNALMSNGSTISTCVQQEDGSYVIELSNGRKFTVLPEGAKYSSLVSCVEMDGVMYWALNDKDGELVTLRDADGKPIPVDAGIEVELIDGVYYLVVNGQKFVTGYESADVVQVFASCTPLKDASGHVYAVTFTLGEGIEVTVSVDGYKGVIFRLPNDNVAVLTDYFIDFGQTHTFLMETQGVVDYVMQIPDGWRVTERLDKASGYVYLDIKAPSKDAVHAEAAVASGDLKVVSVVEGGKAAVSKMTLSTHPYKTLNISAAKATIEVYAGVDQFAYGLISFDDYSQEAVLAKVTELLANSSTQAGYFFSNKAIDKMYSEILGVDSLEGMDYFWTVPVSGNEPLVEAYSAVRISPVSVSLEVPEDEVTVLNAKVSFWVKGADYVYVGVAAKSETAFEEIIESVNGGLFKPCDLAAYAGLASFFNTPDFEDYPLNYNTEYYAWVIPVEDGRTTYAEEDIISVEFKTKDINHGGSLEISASEPVLTPSSIVHQLECEDAAMIYYAYLSESDGKRYSAANITNETKIAQIEKQANFTVVRGNSAYAEIDGLIPETTKWLFAVPVGHDGLYGKVVCKSAKSSQLQFNNLSVSVDASEISAESAVLNITTTGGTPVDYVYWVGPVDDPFWYDKETCNSSKLTAQKYIAANPDAEPVQKAMKKFGQVDADGKLVLTDLLINRSYVAVVLAKDENGLYSKCGYKSFQTDAINLGKDYASEDSEKYAQMKATIEQGITWLEESFKAGAGQGQGFASYAFDIQIPTNLTAYISCFTTEAAVNGGSKVDIIVALEEMCSSMTSVGRYVVDPATGAEPRHPDWVDDNGKLIEGSLVNIYTMYAHGNPDNGIVTYFASEGHDDTHCPAWEAGACSNYAQQVATINKLTSLDYWREYIVDFGNYAYQGDPYHEYSRRLEDPEKIESIATQYYEIYCKYYAGAEPLVYVNDGSPLRVQNREATGFNSETGKVEDVVTILLKDTDGNYYDPMYFQVPNHF